MKQAAKPQPASAPNDGNDTPFVPSYVMTREHYERLAREVAGQK